MSDAGVRNAEKVKELELRVSELENTLTLIYSEADWAYHTISSKLTFGLDEQQAVYRRESRAKGVFITIKQRIKKAISE